MVLLRHMCVGFLTYIFEPFRLFTILLSPMYIMIILHGTGHIDSEAFYWLQPIGIIYEMVGFMLMILSTSVPFIFKIKIKVPKKKLWYYLSQNFQTWS